MNFAVELNETETTPAARTPGTPGTPGRPVKTGDERTLTPFIIVACVTGTLFLLLALLGMRESKEEKRTKRRGGAA